MAHKRKNFPPRIKAAIFARDRATCCFTGKSVWIFDYGTSPLWDTDWPDHKIPSARGGSNELDNGVCASSWANSKKSDNTRDTAYLFCEGKPTDNYLHAVGSISPELQRQLKRLSGIVDSDWHLGRAAKDVLIAVENTAWPEGEKRTPTYWCKSALKHVKRWRKTSVNMQSLEMRGVLLTPLDEDQRILLRLRNSNSLADVQELVRDLVPWRRANWRAYDKVTKALSRNTRLKAGALDKALAEARRDPYVSRRFYRWLSTIAKPLRATGLVLE
jgi:hypothetical protein